MRARLAKTRRAGKACIAARKKAAGRARAQKRKVRFKAKSVAVALQGHRSRHGPAAGTPMPAVALPAEHREKGRLLRSLIRSTVNVSDLAASAAGCSVDMPMERAMSMSIEERIVHGDVRAIRDAVAELICDLQNWIGDYDDAVGESSEAKARIDEVRAAKMARGELKFFPEDES